MLLICQNATVRLCGAWIKIYCAWCSKTYSRFGRLFWTPPLIPNGQLGAPAFVKFAYCFPFANYGCNCLSRSLFQLIHVSKFGQWNLNSNEATKYMGPLTWYWCHWYCNVQTTFGQRLWERFVAAMETRFTNKFENTHLIALDKVPQSVRILFRRNNEYHSYSTTAAHHLHIPPVKLDLITTGIKCRGAIVWNIITESGINLDVSETASKNVWSNW